MKYAEIKELTQKLRRNATKHEQIMWRFVRKKTS